MSSFHFRKHHSRLTTALCNFSLYHAFSLCTAASHQVPIVFAPVEVGRYQHSVNVIINGQLHRALRVSGQGVRFQVGPHCLTDLL